MSQTRQRKRQARQHKQSTLLNGINLGSLLSVGCKVPPQNLNGIPSHGNQRWRNRPLKFETQKIQVATGDSNKEFCG